MEATQAERDKAETYLSWARRVMAVDSRERGLVNATKDILNLNLSAPNAGKDNLAWEDRILRNQCHQELASLRGHKGAVNAVAWDPLGKYLASGGDDRVLRIWDTASGALLREVPGQDASITALIWSCDGQYLACSSQDGTILVRDRVNFDLPTAFKGNPGKVVSVAWSPDSNFIASGGGRSGIVTVWDRSSRREFTRLGPFAAPGVDAVSWSHDGRQLAVGHRRTGRGRGAGLESRQ